MSHLLRIIAQARRPAANTLQEKRCFFDRGRGEELPARLDFVEYGDIDNVFQQIDRTGEGFVAPFTRVARGGSVAAKDLFQVWGSECQEMV